MHPGELRTTIEVAKFPIEDVRSAIASVEIQERAEREMMRNILSKLVFAVIAGMTAVSSIAQELIVEDGVVAFVSGGVGGESIERMTALTRRFNLKLVFATNAGNYLADVAVRIDDAHGNKVLDTVSEGPWLLVNTVPGRYRIRATLSAETVDRWTTVPAGGRRDLILRWDAPVD